MSMKTKVLVVLLAVLAVCSLAVVVSADGAQDMRRHHRVHVSHNRHQAAAGAGAGADDDESSGELSVSSKDDGSESESSGDEESSDEGKSENTGNNQVAEIPKTTAKSIMLSNYNRIEDIDPKKKKNKGLILAEESQKRFREEMVKKKKGESDATIKEEAKKSDAKHEAGVKRTLEAKNKKMLTDLAQKKMKEEAKKRFAQEEEDSKQKQNKIKIAEEKAKAKLKEQEEAHKASEKQKVEEFNKSQEQKKKAFKEEMEKKNRKQEQERKHEQKRREEAKKREEKFKRENLQLKWPAYGGTYMHPRVDKWGDMCFLSGMARGRSGLIAVLPIKCRPKGRLMFNSLKGGSDARIDIIPDGRVILIAYTNHARFVSLDGIAFAASSLSNLQLVWGWRPYGGGYRAPDVRIQSGLVMLSGLIRSGRWGYLARVPNEARPLDGRLVFSASNHQHVTRVDVLTSGLVARAGGFHNHHFVSLDGITYSRHGGAAVRMHNGWHNFGHGYRGLSHKRVGHVCVVSGLIRNNHRNWHHKAHIATLPHSCRPRRRLLMAGNVNMRSARVDIINDGRIFYIAGRMSHPWLAVNFAFIAQ